MAAMAEQMKQLGEMDRENGNIPTPVGSSGGGADGLGEGGFKMYALADRREMMTRRS